ncbi:hypothetical protein ACJX0J_019044 [Zea mays]
MDLEEEFMKKVQIATRIKHRVEPSGHNFEPSGHELNCNHKIPEIPAEENQEQGKQSSNKENKATSHTPLIDHHYKTYHHRQFQIHHHLAFCCPVGRMIVNTWVPSREELQSRNSTKNITADHNFSQIITILRKGIKRDMENIVMEVAKEGEKKGGTKGKIVMKTDYASCIIHYIKQAETWQNMLDSIILEQAHCNMLVTQEDQEIEEYQRI